MWLLLALKFWELVGTTNRVLLENECSLSGVDDHRLWGHSNPLAGKFFLTFMYSQVVRTQLFLLTK